MGITLSQEMQAKPSLRHTVKEHTSLHKLCVLYITTAYHSNSEQTYLKAHLVCDTMVHNLHVLSKCTTGPFLRKNFLLMLSLVLVLLLSMFIYHVLKFLKKEIFVVIY